MPKVSTVTEHSSYYGAKLPGLRRLARLLTAAVLTGALPFETSFGQELMGRASVIDADTIEIHGQRIRLLGVDAP